MVQVGDQVQVVAGKHARKRGIVVAKSGVILTVQWDDKAPLLVLAGSRCRGVERATTAG